MQLQPSNVIYAIYEDINFIIFYIYWNTSDDRFVCYNFIERIAVSFQHISEPHGHVGI